MFGVESSILTNFLDSIIFFTCYFLWWRVNAIFVFSGIQSFFFKVRVEEDRVTFLGVGRSSVRNGFSA